MKNKRVAIIGTVGLPAKYGGFETLAHHLVKQLHSKYSLTVYCSKRKYAPKERVTTYNGAKLKYINLDANGISSILYDTLSILHALFFSDILLILGVSGAWMLPFVRLFTNKKIVISIDGIEWKRAKWSLPAKLYLRWAEKIAVKYSHVDISDNESIQDYTALRYGTISRVIEYGADHVSPILPTNHDIKEFPFLAHNYAFKVCRIEPENNVEMILRAFAKHLDQNLVIVGNWEASAFGQQLKQTYSKTPNVVLLDPIYDQREIDLLRSNASLYVHGHSSGGTNPSLVEAMYLGLPILCFGVSYNRTTTEKSAIYFLTQEELEETISSLNSTLLNQLGQRMKSIAKRRYRWDIVANGYHRLFQEALVARKKQRVIANSNTIAISQLQQLEIGHLQSTKLIFEK